MTVVQSPPLKKISSHSNKEGVRHWVLQYTDNFDTALEIIFSDKKIKDKGNFLKFILIKKPDLKSKVDELSEKYKVNIECN